MELVLSRIARSCSRAREKEQRTGARAARARTPRDMKGKMLGKSSSSAVAGGATAGSRGQRYIDNTIGISASSRTRIKNLLVRNIVWCFSYAVLCISWYVSLLAIDSLASMV